MPEITVSATIYSGDPEEYVRQLGADVLGTTDLDLGGVAYTSDNDGAVMISGVVRTRSD